MGTKSNSDTLTHTEESIDLDLPWNVIVWNDPINLMTYVVRILQKVFGHPSELATKLMLEVHRNGRSLVATESREQAEFHVMQLHEYGIQATLEKADA